MYMIFNWRSIRSKRTKFFFFYVGLGGYVKNLNNARGFDLYIITLKNLPEVRPMEAAI